MSTDKLDWDIFWDNYGYDPLPFINKPSRWEDVCWKIGLESWFKIFEEIALGKKILECGCGSAILSRYMAERGYNCTMLDYSENSLKKAKKTFDIKGLNGEFLVGDINKLSVKEGSFDIVFSGGVLEFFNELESPIKEMTKTLKTGGIFSANMVPRKISIQTLADIERTIVYSIKNILNGNNSEVFKTTRLVPKYYSVNNADLNGYIEACNNAGLHKVKGFYTTPFPCLALPKILSKLYVRYLMNHLDYWQRFNSSPDDWKRWVGITYTIYGVKK